MIGVILFHESERGRSDVREFIAALRPGIRERVIARLRDIREGKFPLVRPYAAQLRGDIWEIRIKAQGANYHFLYARTDVAAILLLVAFTKKTAAVPQNEIERAERRFADWQEREARRKG